MLTPVFYCYIILFNYGGKKARDVGLSCRCHLNNILPNSTFYESMGWRVTCLFCFVLFFICSDNRCLLQQRTEGFRLTIKVGCRGITCNPVTLEAEFRRGVGSIPVGDNSSSI